MWHKKKPRVNLYRYNRFFVVYENMFPQNCLIMNKFNAVSSTM